MIHGRLDVWKLAALFAGCLADREGKLTGDDAKQAQGKAEQAKSDIKDAGHAAADAVRDATDR